MSSNQIVFDAVKDILSDTDESVPLEEIHRQLQVADLDIDKADLPDINELRGIIKNDIGTSGIESTFVEAQEGEYLRRDKLTYLKAIEIVLRSTKYPLSAYRILAELDRKQLIKRDPDLTQHKTISSRIWEEIKKNEAESKFYRVRHGTYMLREFLKEYLPDINPEDNATRETFFVVIEGLDGSGKTAAAHKVAQILRANRTPKQLEISDENVLLTFEPHDPSASGYFIRQVLTKKHKVSEELFALAFATNRKAHFERVIEPFLDGGNHRICICDRYYLSSLVYQSKGNTDADFEEVMDLNYAAPTPDLTIFLDVDTKTSYGRMNKRDEPKDLFDKRLSDTKEKYEKAIDYLHRKTQEKIVKVDANGNLDDVVSKIGEVLTGQYGRSWVRFQDPMPLEFYPRSFALENNLDLSVQIYAKQFEKEWWKVLNADPAFFLEYCDDVNQLVVDSMDTLSYHDLTSIFIDSIRMMGYSVHENLPWSEMDGFALTTQLPPNLDLTGAAIVLGENQNQVKLTRRILADEKMLDFLFLLDLRTTRKIARYGRDPVVEGNSLLPPTTIPMNRNDLVKVILGASLYGHCFVEYQGQPDYLDKMREIVHYLELSLYWDAINQALPKSKNLRFETEQLNN